MATREIREVAVPQAKGLRSSRGWVTSKAKQSNDCLLGPKACKKVTYTHPHV